MPEEPQVKKSLITLDQAKEYLQLMIGKPAWIDRGYGGIIFLEVDGLQRHPKKYKGKVVNTLYSGEYRIYCDENWEFASPRKTVDRWHSEISDIEKLFKNFHIRKILNIEVEGNFDKTHFYFEGGYRWTIVKDESLTTFHYDMARETTEMYVDGNGTIELIEYGVYEEHPWRQKKTYRRRRKESEKITIPRKLFRKHYPGLLSIDPKKAKEFISNMYGEKIQTVEINSASKFTLGFGKKHVINQFGDKRARWQLRIEEIWTLSQSNEILLDVKKDKFFFEDKLKKILRDKKILYINFDKDGQNLHIKFEDDLVLQLSESG